MKYIKSILLSGVGALTLSLTSCNDWLDVNTDPSHLSAETATIEARLPHIEFYTNSAVQFAAWRSTMSMGDWTRNVGGGTYYNMSIWYPTSGIVTTSYQWWFVGAAVNIQDMYDKAMAAEAYHYAGVAKVIRAYGFMLMTDLYGEMPYTDAVGTSLLPVYDNGKTIYLGCLSELDEGIELLQKTQPSGIPTLAEGDSWNNGDVNKWLKLANLLKARWINKLIKKGPGSYKDGKYDAATILASLDKAMMSNADNTIVNHTDDNGVTHDVLGWDEPVDYSPLYSVSGMNGGYMPTKMLVDNLTNFAGLGVEDPRADHIIPWAWSYKGASSPAGLKWVGNWRRGVGVDMQSGIQSQGGPLRASFNVAKRWYIDSANPERLGDTIYVDQTSSSKGYAANVDLLYRRLANNDDAKQSGTFYTRVSSPTYIGTYAEACFIKAEVLFKQGDKNGAYTAYKNGIKASIDLMNDKLETWCAEDASLRECPSFTPMTQESIDNYLANGIGKAADLTLGKILTQKRLALMFSVEIWNDMRRYDFDKSLFLGWDMPAQHAYVASALKAIPEGKQFRRWQQCSHELNYNNSNLQAIGSEVPGANLSATDQNGNSINWNAVDDIWTLNVWWDSDQP